MSDLDDRIRSVLERGLEAMETIVESGERDDEDVREALDDLEAVVDEAEELLATADLARLAAVIDWDRLPGAVDVEDLPEAIREGDPDEAVSLWELVDVDDLDELWEGVDGRELWRNKREFDAALADLTDDGDDGEAATAGDATDGSDTPSVRAHDLDRESVENAVQAEVSDAVGAFRETLLDAHDRIEAVREANRNRFPDRRRNRSRNPTAVSTLPRGQGGHWSGSHHSSVPEETRYSTAPNRRRIYGTRFDRREEGDDG